MMYMYTLHGSPTELRHWVQNLDLTTSCIYIYIYTYIYDIFPPQGSLTELRQWVQNLDLSTECKFNILSALVDHGYTTLDVLGAEDPEVLFSLQGMPQFKPGSRLMIRKALQELREVRVCNCI
jgi:hypothetical protein